MDQHPIPQNVTGFQFKLIGNMTVRQFGYVAVGVIAAVIIYYLPLPGALSVLLKIILIPLFGSSGAIIAFIPIDGRPIDVMLGNFMQALFSPNQYVYHKTGIKFSFSGISQNKAQSLPHSDQKAHGTPKQRLINDRGRELQRLLTKSSEGKVKNAQDSKEAAFLNSILINTSTQTLKASPIQSTLMNAPAPTAPIQQKPAPVTPQTTQDLKPNPKPVPSPEILSEKEEALKKQLEFTKQEEAISHDPKDQASIHQKALGLEAQVKEIQTQKHLLEQEIASLKNQLSAQQKPALPAVSKPTAQTGTKPDKAASSHVRNLPKEMNKSMGILVSDTPNVVSGTVKDPRGNVLPNILVEIKDKGGNPVRAFKTNALGNFASATPLTPGNYTITLEDSKKLQTFDTIQITATNQIMLPLEIISYDKREELRKDLFS